MPYEKFLIAPLTSGAQQNVKPWLLIETAFSELQNLYTWRGSVKKRFGARVMNGSKGSPQNQLFTRLRVNVGTTDGNGDLTVTVPGAAFNVGQMFSCGDEIFTVVVAGTPGTMLISDNALTASFNTNTGQVVITGSNATTDLFFYPAEPVMHFGTYEVASINDEQLFAFDEQFAYQFVYTTGWNRVTGGTDSWTGTDSDFYWTTNYRGATSDTFLMFITNNVAADAMRYWDGTTFNAFGSAATTPINAAANYIKTCKFILPFKDRLILFNVTENLAGGDTVFRNRIRYSQNGSPVAVDAWREDVVGKGSYLEAPVKQSIISAEFIRDRLIVFFEESTWELAYTGNEVLPFRFQQINTELGVESMHSVIPFDKHVLGFGNNGIHASSGVSIERIDEAIPYTIFDVSNDNDGPRRVHGIQDYWTEMVYWTYSSNKKDSGFNDTFPNQVLVYNYENKTWSFNDDSITAFGNYQLGETLTWADIESQWQETGAVWYDPSLEDRFKSVIAGNQQGYTFVIDSKEYKNSLSLQVTDIAVTGAVVTFDCIDHNLPQGSFVYFENIQSDGGNMDDDDILNNKIYEVNMTSDDEFTVNTGEVAITGTYIGGGVVTRVSEIGFLTKEFNFFNKTGTNIAFNQIDFLVDKTENGEVTFGIYPSSSSRELYTDSLVSGSSIGTDILETSPYALVPLELAQVRFWHSIYISAVGENIQLELSLSDEQIMDPDIAFSDFQLNAMMFYATPTNQFGG